MKVSNLPDSVEMWCRVCQKQYTPKDDQKYGGPGDSDWHPSHGRCYGCYLELLCEIFGGFVEPVFLLGDCLYGADGVWDACDEPEDLDYWRGEIAEMAREAKVNSRRLKAEG